MLPPLFNCDPGDETTAVAETVIPCNDYAKAVARAEALKTPSISACPVRPPNGKYEGCDDYELALMLDELSLDGTDEEFGSVEEGAWHGRVGRFIIQEDDRGFFSYGIYMDDADATRAFHGMMMVD